MKYAFCHFYDKDTKHIQTHNRLYHRHILKLFNIFPLQDHMDGDGNMLKICVFKTLANEFKTV